MQSSKAILDTLNAALTTELTSINRYFLHSRMFKNWGFEALASKAYKKSIKDMKQADELIERILMLEGLPNLQKLAPLHIGENTEEMFACDLKFQQQQIDELKSAVALCEVEQDYVSRALLSSILDYEEDYIDWLETQEHQIGSLGLPNYLQSQIEKGE